MFCLKVSFYISKNDKQSNFWVAWLYAGVLAKNNAPTLVKVEALK